MPTSLLYSMIMWWGEMARSWKKSPDLGNSSPRTESIDVRS
jgi:hypothetical protein